VSASGPAARPPRSGRCARSSAGTSGRCASGREARRPVRRVAARRRDAKVDRRSADRRGTDRRSPSGRRPPPRTALPREDPVPSPRATEAPSATRPRSCDRSPSLRRWPSFGCQGCGRPPRTCRTASAGSLPRRNRAQARRPRSSSWSPHSGSDRDASRWRSSPRPARSDSRSPSRRARSCAIPAGSPR